MTRNNFPALRPKRGSVSRATLISETAFPFSLSSEIGTSKMSRRFF